MSNYRELIKIRRLRKAKKYTECIEILTPFFENAVNSGQIDADVVRSLAEVFHVSGHTPKGLQLYGRAITSDPKNTLLIGRYGEYLAFSGNKAKGLAFVEKALSKVPWDENLALSKGIIIHRYIGDLDAAAAFMENFKRRYPKATLDHDLAKELEAVLYKISKREAPPVQHTPSVWESLGARHSVSKDAAIAAGYSGFSRK